MHSLNENRHHHHHRLEVRELFGGNGAFLALPPQCVPDSLNLNIQIQNLVQY